jgi:hypothetical protein
MSTLTTQQKSDIDKLWTEFWTGGITNPLTVIEQISFLMFARLLDVMETTGERKAERTKKEFHGRFKGATDPRRWKNFKQKDAAEMLRVVRDEVFPHFRKLNGGTTFAEYMQDAQLMIQKPSLLVSAVNMIDKLPITDGDAKGDLYEYLLSKLTTAGINGQFRTPRHIIRFMVELLEPKPTETIGDPACGTAGFLVETMQYLLEEHTSPQGRLKGENGEVIYTGDKLEPYRAHIQGGMFHGFDFDATMLRIASMNLMLHGVDNPDIHYQDTLSNSFPEKFAKQADGRLRRHPRQPAVQGQPRRGRRSPDADAGGEDEEDRAALRGAHPAHAQEGRAQRDHRARRRAVRIEQGAHRAARHAGEGQPARSGDLAAERRVQALRGRVDGHPGVHQGGQDRPCLLLRRRRRRLLARRQARSGQRERPARRTRALAEAEREEGH